MSEKLGMRSEEWAARLRSCWNDPPNIACKGCPYKREGCRRGMALAAADEIERLTAELEEEKGLTLHIGEDGVASVKEEPYATVEVATEEDFDLLKLSIGMMTPKLVSVNWGDKWIECPVCGNILATAVDDLDEQPHFCSRCGQALDWGEEETNAES